MLLTHDCFSLLVRTDFLLALVGAALLVPAAVAAAALRNRLPVWRKGLWLATLVVPAVWLALTGMTAVESADGAPAGWVSRTLSRPMPDAGDAPRAAPVTRRVLLGCYGAWVVCVLGLELGAVLRLRGLIRGAEDVTDRRRVALYTHLAKAGRAGASRDAVSTRAGQRLRKLRLTTALGRVHHARPASYTRSPSSPPAVV
jgi:hypothetical protein